MSANCFRESATNLDMKTEIVFLASVGGQEIPECRAALVAMKNGDIYSIVLTSEELALLGVAEFEGLSPLVPVKIDALCGPGIRGNEPFRIKGKHFNLIYNLVASPFC